LPVAGSKPNTNKSIATIIDMKIKGIKTIIQDITPIPDWHKAFNKNVMIIITINLKNAVLYKPLKVSIIIWVKEKAKYIKAGAHISILLFIYIKKKYIFIIFVS
jgi:hypothetical protein